MKRVVILGAGTAGTMVANRLTSRLPADWTLTVIDPSGDHLYQPGLLFLPFGRPRRGERRSPARGHASVGRAVGATGRARGGHRREARRARGG